MKLPVVYDASSDNSHTMARATSIARPPRPIGSCGPSRATRPGSPPLARIPGSMIPARAEMRRIPSPAPSPGGPRGRAARGVRRALRGGVVPVPPGRAGAGRARGTVDDRPPAPAVPRRHAADGLARAHERAGDVGREDAPDARRVDLFDPRLPLEDA